MLILLHWLEASEYCLDGWDLDNFYLIRKLNIESLQQTSN